MCAACRPLGGETMTGRSLLLLPERSPKKAERPVRVLGIDLGTTNSTVAEAVWDPLEKGPPKIRCLEIDQETQEGVYTHLLVPSVIALLGQREWVGEGAKRMRTRPVELGLELYRDIFWDCKNHMGVRRTYSKAPQGYRSAKEVGGRVLAFLMAGANADGDQPVDRVVVTVPASFRAAQRKDTVEAARLAGIEFHAGDLLDEPVAAFLDYLTTQEAEELLSENEQRPIVVFDFGGGTCDIAVFRVSTGREGLQIEPLSVSRYHRLGGGDIDLAIAEEVLLPQLMEQNGIKPGTLSYKEKSGQILPALLGIAESLKIGLCTEITRMTQLGKYKPASTQKKLPGVHECRLMDGRNLCLSTPALTVAAFEKALAPFLDRDLLVARETEYRMTTSIFAPLTDALDRAGIGPEEVHACLLVGGSSMIPQVQDALRRFFSKGRLLTFESEDRTQTAVARGAAIQALALALHGKGIAKVVCGESVRIKTNTRGVELIPRGAPLPFPKDREWAENHELKVPKTELHRPLELRVELEDAKGRSLGASKCSLDPPLSKGAPLALLYRMDENQDLQLRLQVEGQPPVAMTFENPLTNVANPNSKRDRIEEIEEEIRTGKVAEKEMAERCREVAGLYRELGLKEKALDLFEHLLRASGGSDPGLMHQIALIADAMGDVEKAEKYFRECARQSHWGGALFNLSLSQRRRGHFQEALQSIKEALRLENEPVYHIQKALVLDSLRQREPSRECLRRGFALFDPVPLLNDWQLGWYEVAAKLLGEEEALKEAQAEKRKRAQRHTGEEAEEGFLPDAVNPLVWQR